MRRRSPRDVLVQPPLDPRVVELEHDAHPRRADRLGEVERLVERMQEREVHAQLAGRLERDAHARLLGERHQRLDQRPRARRGLLPRPADRVAGQHHQTVGPELRRGVEVASRALQRRALRRPHRRAGTRPDDVRHETASRAARSSCAARATPQASSLRMATPIAPCARRRERLHVALERPMQRRDLIDREPHHALPIPRPRCALECGTALECGGLPPLWGGSRGAVCDQSRAAPPKAVAEPPHSKVTTRAWRRSAACAG